MSEEKKYPRDKVRASDPGEELKEAHAVADPPKKEIEETMLKVTGIEYSGKTVTFRVQPVVFMNGQKKEIKRFDDRVSCVIE